MLSGKALTLWKAVLIFLLILIIARFVVVGEAKILFNTLSSDGDELAFLSLGLGIFEDGVLTDGARPPLYPFILAFIAEREWDYFTWAKILTMGMGVVAIVATFLAGASLFSWETGVVAAFLLASNKEFHVRASTVYTDVLFVSILIGAWYFLIKSFNGWRYCIMAGIFVGLAYLSKGSGPLLLGAWGLVAIMHYRGQIWRQRQLLLVPLFALIVMSPRMVYNVRTFGDPLYTFDSAHVLWMDSWDQAQVADPADLPTIETYFQTHTAADIVDRMQFGSARLNAFLPRVLIPSRTVEPKWLIPFLLTGALLIGGAVLVLRREWITDYYRYHHLTINVSLLLFGVFYFFLAWYARMQVESRFIIPLLGPLYLLLADLLVGLGRRIGQWASTRGTTERLSLRSSWAWGAYVLGVALIIVWSMNWLVQTALADRWSLSVDPFVSDREANVEPEAILDWLIQDRPTGEATVIFGPSKSLPLWKFPHRFTVERPPIDLESWAAFQSYVDGIGPDYLIMDSDTVRRRRQALSEYFAYEEKVGIQFEQVPAGWALAYLHNDVPHTWAIFQPAAPAEPLSANFGDQIELLGYELIATGNGPERRVRVALFWQAATALSENYTTFVHLTAPDGFVKAQQDQQPFNGLWPTGRWTPGNVLADRYTIPLDESIQPGEYLLLAGLYAPQTGQRLALIDGPPAPSPDAVLLGTLQIK